MQINNTPSNQNFGMALRIKPEAKSYLQNCATSTLEQLQKAGEELKNTKFWNMEVTEQGPAARYCADIYRAPFNIIEPPKGDKVRINATLDLSNAAGGNITTQEIALKYADSEAAKKAYEKLSQGDSLDRVVEITKNLDSQKIERIAKEQAEAQAKQHHNNMVSSLLEEFGIKEI